MKNATKVKKNKEKSDEKKKRKFEKGKDERQLKMNKTT